jgi:hypothetical protein
MGEAGAIISALKNNYGHAGMVFSEYLGQKVQTLPQLVKDTIDYYQKEFNARPDERYWIAAMATLTLGAQISNNLNLTRFDVGAMVDFLANALTRLRKTRTGGDMDVSKPTSLSSVLAYFLNSHRRAIIVTDVMHTGAGPIGLSSQVRIENAHDLTYAQALVGHIARTDNRIRISKRQFLTWCQDIRMPGGTLLKNLEEQFGAKTIHSRLGTGTTFNANAKEYLIDIDCRHPDLVTLLSN